VDDLIRQFDNVGARVSTDTPHDYSTDFGQLVHRVPRVVVRATCEDHVVDTLRTTRRLRLPVAVRGAGHSCFGQTVTDGVLLVNVPDGSVAPRMLGDGLVEVPARLHWREVEAFLNPRGRSVPALADYLDLSVGGTLSVGGYGADSIVHGAQTDHVDRIRLITPDGAAIWCSSQENAELFSYALAGLGQVGVIETAVLRTVPYRAFTTLFNYRYSSLKELVASIEWIAESANDRPLLFKAHCARGRFVSTYGIQTENVRNAISARRFPPVRVQRAAHAWIVPKYRQWRSLVVKLWVAQFSNHGRLWTDFLFDYDGLESFTTFLQPLLERDAFAGCLKSIYIVAIRRLPRTTRFPLEASDSTGASMSFGIGLYSMIPRQDPALVGAVAETVAFCLEKCIALGGRPYRYGWHQMDEHHYQALYGATYDRLLALRRELDPDGLFQR